ncbi:hypothetical protein SPKIRA_02850 [Sphingomonas paucimobilis]|uniref:DNA, contig: SP614 n=1 Tax=Sphingomonas paucimobilis NBRC 13935 TaxID=1219050 RepID=A0A0C9MR23_SPHPI|nr:hypothetical protein SPKIRA_02850 [Sphingomonas paucimobilis]GAN13201.1 hypothetical protein SP6_14_03600 [Sphingomonas paucimobilis NBRC 13935]
MGGDCVVTVTTVGGGVEVVTVRRVTTRRTGLAGTRRWTIFRPGLVCLTTAGRLGLSTMCTAPPPITAPPAAQAVSFARAIRTDIVTSSYVQPNGAAFRRVQGSFSHSPVITLTKKDLRAKRDIRRCVQ